MKHQTGSNLFAAALAGVMAGIALSGCAVGPDYATPPATAPAAYKAAHVGSWKEGQPLDHVPKGAWWEIYGDETLNDLQQRALAANQELKGMVARVEQARASARVARSELLLALDANPGWHRERFSPNQVPNFGSVTPNTFRTPLDLSYEIDLWGRVRRGFESARADAQASLAAFHQVQLTLNSDVAQNYFTLRALDVEMDTVWSTVELRKEEVRLMRSRFEGGIGNELDVARAETELATTQAEAASLSKRRAELENALGILVGENPSSFQLLPALRAEGAPAWNPAPPVIPAGLPSGLLERRPDVAEAERQLAAANARIGVAKAAFFPSVRLTGSGGYLSGDMDRLFNWDSRVWSFGPSLSLPLFAGGRNQANYRRARSTYDESVARYRQQILVAFGDVENSLAGIRYLGDQAEAQNRAVGHARRAAELATERYRAGIVSYLEVVDANRAALQTERVQAQLAGQRLTVSVQLIKALGGGWTDSRIAARSPEDQGSVPAK